MKWKGKPGQIHTLACRCSLHQPTGSGSCRLDRSPRGNAPLSANSCLSRTACPQTAAEPVPRRTRSSEETASTTCRRAQMRNYFEEFSNLILLEQLSQNCAPRASKQQEGGKKKISQRFRKLWVENEFRSLYLYSLIVFTSWATKARLTTNLALTRKWLTWITLRF